MQTIQFGKLKEQNYTLKESLRALKTNIQFCGDDIKTILFTSAIPNEGKSTVVFDLARSITDSQKSVLVIDADIRKSVMAGRLRARVKGGGEILGLSHLLSGQSEIEDVLYSTNINGLFIIFAGPSAPNPTEMLDKQYFDNLLNFAKKQFDYILIDCPPMGAAIDAAVVGKHVDGAIIIVSQGEISYKLLANVKKQLENSGVRILGSVLNKVKMKKNSYYGKYYGSYYGDYYESDKKKNSNHK